MKDKTPKPVIHRLRNNSGSMIITIPAEVCNKFGYDVGDKFEITIIDPDELKIKKIY
jgi:hypothetical protein